ncbi:paired box protein Pax-6-like [Mizuhopecten yessoensis]|uniref:Retinal homeobox protein Rx1 n=1 Tax=Mizuhopecten yessoensis TaxID=6573 RepID=A0A210PNY9_MIZYE|nr:paired box protein Pax-6-like [Mizuhopecten yessoensis]OWF38219.1 Retinal homeobox protein Rx1 [Mizuhopecten yessoensis]
MTMGAPSERKCSQRNRIKYTTEQLERLEREFGISHYPDTATMENLAFGLNVSLDRVSIWFQNRRSKFKRQSKDSHVTWMRKQIFNQDTSSTSCRVVQPKFVPQRHVLSAPAYPLSGRRDLAWHMRPSSNLHYLPSAPAIFDQLADAHHGQSPPSRGNGCPTSPETAFYTYSQCSDPGSQSPPQSPPGSSPMTSPLSTHALMMSHLMNEGHQMVTSTSSYQTCANQTPPSCVFADYNNPMPLYPPCSTPFSSRPQLTGV